MSVVEDLTAARAIVEKGWCRGTFEDSDGNHCALGGVNLATTGTIESTSRIPYFERQQAVIRVLQDHLPEKFPNILYYNDAEGRTKEDILTLIDKTIADLGGAV